jgi:hypothetical protein
MRSNGVVFVLTGSYIKLFFSKAGPFEKYKQTCDPYLGPNQSMHALQRQNTEISKQIFPEKEYRGVSANFHIHAPVSNLYIPTTGLPILLEEICRPILGLCKSLTDT